MNTNDLLLRWSNMSLDQIEDEIREGKDQEAAAELLGADVVAEAQALSFSPTPDVREPVVLLPGIMGSLLSSIRGVTTLMWINPLLFTRGNARYLRMNEDGTDDGCSEIETMPVGLEITTYLGFAMRLKQQTELYEFPYDWRRSVAYNADQLHQRLERWAGGTDRQFTLVGHSMGGLVSRTYMARHPRSAEKRVRRLITMGTPYFGSTNAIESLLTGNSLMDTVDKLNNKNAMREVVRSFPGLYNLLPAPQEFFPSGQDFPANYDIYDASAWQNPSIRQNLLDNTRELHRQLAGSDAQVPVAQIAGCNLDTLRSLAVTFEGMQKFSLMPNRIAEGEDSGDGTVPLWSSRLPGADIYYIQEKHGDLPKNRQVAASVLNLIQDGRCALPTALPPRRRSLGGFSFSVPGEEEDTPVEEAAEVVPEVAAAELRMKIESGTASQDDLKLLHFAL
jgi:pimeloyl-ACP methyl ester carboxylesterase